MLIEMKAFFALVALFICCSIQIVETRSYHIHHDDTIKHSIAKRLADGEFLISLSHTARVIIGNCPNCRRSDRRTAKFCNQWKKNKYHKYRCAEWLISMP